MTDLQDMDLRAPAIDNPDRLTLPPFVEVLPGRTVRTSLRRVSWSKMDLFGVNLFLFILAITLKKEGARSLAAFPIRRSDSPDSRPGRPVGFGCLILQTLRGINNE